MFGFDKSHDKTIPNHKLKDADCALFHQPRVGLTTKLNRTAQKLVFVHSSSSSSSFIIAEKQELCFFLTFQGKFPQVCGALRLQSLH